MVLDFLRCFLLLLVNPLSVIELFHYLLNAGIYPYNTLIITWMANNLPNEHVRSISLPFLICIANASGIASSQIYPSKDSPRYILGNSVSLAMEAVALVSVGAIYLLLRRRNARIAVSIANGELVEPTFKYVI